MDTSNLTENIEQNLWNFLCAQERFYRDIQEKKPKEILERDKRYLNLTLCPCIGSIKKCYISEKNTLFKSDKLSDIKDSDEKVLWSLFMLCGEYLAHDHHYPFKEMDLQKFNNYSVLYSKESQDLDINRISEVLKNAVTTHLGFKDKKELLTDIQKRNFPNLTSNCYHLLLEEYLTSAIKLNNTLENLYGVKPSSDDANDIIEGSAVTPELIRDYKKAVVWVRNFAIHDRLPILTKEELEEGRGTLWLNDILVSWYEFWKKKETEEDRKKGPLGQRLLQEYRAFKALPLSQKTVITPEPDEKYKHCHFEPLPKEWIKEAQEYEKEQKKEEKKGNFGITCLERIRNRRDFP